MADTARRIERLERILGMADCICSDVVNRVECLVVPPEWDAERLRLEEAALQTSCTIHGAQTPIIVRLSPADAAL